MTVQPVKRKINEISVDEVSLYDRQIRLWGLKAQERMRNSRILAINISGLQAEVLKNICLAGIGHLTLMDDNLVSERDLTNFLVDGSAGQNRAKASLSRLQALNPRVEIAVSETSIEHAKPEFYASFDIVCMTNANPKEMLKVNKICHENGVKFFAAENMGFQSFIFSDLVEHSFTTETKRTGSGKEEILKNTRTDKFDNLLAVMDRKFGFVDKKSIRKWKRVAHPLYFALLVIWKFYLAEKRYPSIVDVDTKSKSSTTPKTDVKDDRELLEKTRKSVMKSVEVEDKFLPMEYLLQVARSRGHDINPASAIVGGFLGQEILKVLAQKEIPFNNFFLHDAMDAVGFMMKV